MKLLYITQAIDLDDPTLSVYHNWAAEIGSRFESTEVICLKEGRHRLPPSIRVHSLGKERGSKSGVVYAWRFLKLVWQRRHDYDAVFVHMNQEYILIAGWLWKLLHKRIYLWRNHYAGSLFTDIAAAFCEKVFCTSKYSYTARYAKTILMPVGVDTKLFSPDATAAPRPSSLLFLARIAKSKRPELLLDAANVLDEKGIAFTLDFYGAPRPEDSAYYTEMVTNMAKSQLQHKVTFNQGVPNEQLPAIYRSHQIFVNTSPAGMLDKTIFEAAACGCLVLAASPDWEVIAGEQFFFIPESLSQRIEAFLTLSPSEVAAYSKRLQEVAEEHSLTRLADALRRTIV